jgi:hypothetical protein
MIRETAGWRSADGFREKIEEKPGPFVGGFYPR